MKLWGLCLPYEKCGTLSSRPYGKYGTMSRDKNIGENLNFDLVYTTDIYKSRLLICGLYSNTWPISDASIETFTKYVKTIFVGQKHPTLRIEWTFNLFCPNSFNAFCSRILILSLIFAKQEDFRQCNGYQYAFPSRTKNDVNTLPCKLILNIHKKISHPVLLYF